MRLTRLLTLATAVVLVVAACTSTSASTAPIGGAASGDAGITVGVASSAGFGTVLTGPNGRTLYTHPGDSATSSTCTGVCAAAWPPLTTTGQPSAATGLTGQLATLTRQDGTTQVTYRGMPLYYWQGDAKAGDVTGNGVEGFVVATVGGAAAVPSAAPLAPTPTSVGGYNY